MSVSRSAGFAVVAALALTAPARAQQDVEAEGAVRAFLAAVMSQNPAQLDLVLAPEFQIQRPDATGTDKAGYLAGGFANVSEVIAIRDLVATRNGDIMVVRYVLVVSSTLDGRPVEAEAPRLSVFRREGERWLIVAHANFARIAQ